MQVGTFTLSPGDKIRGYLETEGFASGIKLRIPMLAMAGARPGPLMTVQAAQHGRELNGIEAIRRVFEATAPADLVGTLLCFPIVSTLAVRIRQQDFPDEWSRWAPGGESGNVNRCWPGKADGTLSERIAHAIFSQAVCHADCAVDLHGWTGESMSLVWADEGQRGLARAFGHRIFLLESYATHTSTMFETVCYRHGIPAVTAELVPQNVLSEESIGTGVRGVTNLMRHLGMLHGALDLPAEQFYITPQTAEHLICTDADGLYVPWVAKGAMVHAGDLLGTVYSLETLAPVFEARSPIDGMLFNTGAFRLEPIPETNVVRCGERVCIVKEVIPA